MRPTQRALGLAAAALTIAAASTASAFTIDTPASPGCHEGITTDALRAVRAELATAAPLPSTGDDGAVIDDLPFDVDGDMTDLGGATLLVGIRDNDLKGRSPESLDTLTEVHGDPANQKEHCLRSPTEDEPDGSAESVLDCRNFIRAQAIAAIDGGLDAQGMPDPNRRTVVTVALAFAGKSEVGLPTYYLEIGRGMHAIQDSFAHDWRTADGMKITVALNWVEYTEGNLVESRDGPSHRGPLDQCDDPDALRAQRHHLAIEASEALLRATLDPSLDRDGKLAAVDALLDKYIAYQPGCTSDNGWCDAPERQYTNPGACGCSVPGSNQSGAAASLLALTAMACLGLRRGSKRHVA